MNHHLKADIAALFSGVAAITSWQEQLSWTIQILAALVALVAGIVSLYQRLKKKPPVAE